MTPRQELFVDEYIRLRCKNAVQAAINAGYSEKTASSKASQLIKHREISDLIEHRKSELRCGLQLEFIFDALAAREVMHEILTSAESSDKDRLAVARDFLDRAGFKAADKLDVSRGVTIVREDLDSGSEGE